MIIGIIHQGLLTIHSGTITILETTTTVIETTTVEAIQIGVLNNLLAITDQTWGHLDQLLQGHLADHQVLQGDQVQVDQEVADKHESFYKTHNNPYRGGISV